MITRVLSPSLFMGKGAIEMAHGFGVGEYVEFCCIINLYLLRTIEDTENKILRDFLMFFSVYLGVLGGKIPVESLPQ